MKAFHNTRGRELASCAILYHVSTVLAISELLSLGKRIDKGLWEVRELIYIDG